MGAIRIFKRIAEMLDTAFSGVANDDFMQRKAGAWTNSTATQVTADLSAMIGDSGAGGTKGLVPAPAAGDAAASKFLKADGTWATVSGGGGSGTVTSVAASFTGGIISVGGSPVTTSGTLALTVAGTSGGIPYFSSSSAWASSAALGANQIVVGGGAGAAPVSRTQFTVSSTGMVAIAPGTLVDGTSGFAFTATMPTTITAANNAVNIQVTSAGTSAFGQRAINADLLAGYTGSANNTCARFANAMAGTGTTLVTGENTIVNSGANCLAIATTTGTNVGNIGVANGGNVNVGLYGRAITDKNSATNVGVLGFAKNAGTSPVQVGGFFGLNTSDPTFASAALMCDNGATTSNIFVARDNGTAVFTIADGGAVTITSSLLSTSATAGIGYATGAGGTVTQGGSDRLTGVTLNKVCGSITLRSEAGSTSWQSFTVTNSAVAATDTVRVCQKSGTDKYMIHVTAVGAGSFQVTFATTGGTTTEQPVFNFTVIKAVAA